MVKCAIYCRVSSDEQAEKGTIQAQVDYAKKYLELHGPEMGITEHEFYLDDGISGTVAVYDRPSGVQLITDAKRRKFDILFVYRLDRLARSVKHVLDTYDLMEKHNIALKSMTEAFDTGSPTGKFFMTLLASIAALERDTILERTQGGKDRNARQGHWVSGSPPFGYRIVDKKLNIHEPEAQTVSLIFKLYEEMSMIEIAKYLNAKNIPTPAISKGTKSKTTGKWHAGHISIILRTEAYSGMYKYLKRSQKEKELIEIKVPVIIDRNTYDQTQKKITASADASRGNRGRNYLLKGLIFCSNCKRAMVGSSGDSKSGRVYYRCSGTLDQGQGKKCDTKLVKAADVEDAVWKDIKEFFKYPEKFLKYINDEIQGSRNTINPVKNELREVELAILEKQDYRGRMLSLLAKGIITEEEAEKELKKLSNEISYLLSRKEILFGKQSQAQLFENYALNAQLVIKEVGPKIDNVSDEIKADIIKTFVQRINIENIIGADGKRGTRAKGVYRFAHCMELNISGDAQM